MSNRRSTLVKGSMAFYDEPSARQEFMYNPKEIQDNKDVRWGRANVPGISHPVYQYGSGGARVISFDLFHDGDRARIIGSGSLLYNSRIPNDPGLDVSPWLKFWRALLYAPGSEGAAPQTSRRTPRDGFNFAYWTASAPRKVVFNYGPMWKNVLCVVVRADVKADFFTPKGEVVRATVSLTLEESPDAPQFYSNLIHSNVQLA